jgi:hypothetical protein
MNSKLIPSEVPVAMEGACAISLECWRLRRIAELVNDSNEGSGLRHAVRHITETLEVMGIEVVDFTGRTYDPGMVPEVVEVREDQGLPDGHTVIDETIAPTVTWRGQVVKPGQIILRRSRVRPKESAEVAE